MISMKENIDDLMHYFTILGSKFEIGFKNFGQAENVKLVTKYFRYCHD